MQQIPRLQTKLATLFIILTLHFVNNDLNEPQIKNKKHVIMQQKSELQIVTKQARLQIKLPIYRAILCITQEQFSLFFGCLIFQGQQIQFETLCFWALPSNFFQKYPPPLITSRFFIQLFSNYILLFHFVDQ